MSQDQPPSFEPISPEPLETAPESVLETPPDRTSDESTAAGVEPALTSMETEPLRRASSNKRSTPTSDEILPQTLLRLMGEALVAAQPSLKKQSVKALRGTIHYLEKAVERIEAEPAPKQARKRAPAPSKASENPLSSSSQTLTNKRAPTLSTDALSETFRAFWQQVWRSWRPLLRQIRNRLPVSVNRNFSDRALTGAIAGSLILFLWTASTLLPAKPQPTTIAKTPPPAIDVTSPEPTPKTTPIPPLVKAPEPPKPVEISPAPTSKPSVPPLPLKLTPEQPLIARIQNQVAAISNQYASDLIQSVQANFRSSRLIVNVSDGWYGLSRLQQDNLAGEILRRTETLDFIKLEMVDAAGKLLARSPVVGSEMIILKRSNTLAEAV